MTDLSKLDSDHVWHPFTQMMSWQGDRQLIIERGEGNYLWDVEGRRYLDGISSLWVTVHGHNHPRLNAALRAQIDKVAHSTLLGAANVPSIELAADLVKATPAGLSRVFYSDSGSTAVEIALKQSYQFWQQTGKADRSEFAHLTSSYHGDTVGAVSVGGIDLFHRIFGRLLFDTHPIPAPHPYRHPLGNAQAVRESSLQSLAELLERRSGHIAAVIVEPLVQGAAGMLVHPKGFLRGVAELCKRHQVHLIVDEVATGFGRTGTLFACEQEDVTPDFLCLAKGITGGYLPLAATLTTDAIFEGFLANDAAGKQFFHGHTYTGNPLACAVAVENLRLFEQEQTLTNVNARAAQLAELLAAIDHRAIGDIRQRGLMVGIELVQDRESATPFAPDQRIGAKVCLEARNHGVLLRPLGDVLVLMPPLSITDEQVAELTQAVRRSLQQVVP